MTDVVKPCKIVVIVVMEKKKSIGKNIIISILVQIISLLVNFVLGFVVPKFIDEFQYANWQTYVLYVGYVGVLHFGLLDGIVLRYSGYDFEELDKARIRSQFKILLMMTGIIASFTTLTAVEFFHGISKITIVLVAVGIITKNLITYNSYLFQTTNRISQYATLIVSQRASYGLVVLLLLAFRVNDFTWYCLADLGGDVIGIVVAKIYNQGMYFGKSLSLRETFREWRINVSSGILLMLANWSSMLLIGGAKMVIHWRWNQIIFGKVSFAFSISNLFLTFVTAVSVVLFPQMKRMEERLLPKLYFSIRGILSPFLIVVMLAYFPGCWILEKYLPAYDVSLVYLGILLPIIIYTSKVTLLTNNYMKAYRQERLMLYINVMTVTVAFVLYFLSAYQLNSLGAVLFSTVLVTMMRSILSEIVVMRTIHVKCVKEFVLEAAMTVVFIICVNFLSRWLACGVYAMALIAYLFFQKKNILSLLESKR